MSTKIKGERIIDSSVRFDRIKSNTLSETIMELVDNMFTFGDTFGEIKYEENIQNNTVDITFKNDGCNENIPSYEQFLTIIGTAGESISSKQGVSRRGQGIEIVALSSRRRKESKVNVTIEICRDNKKYGATLIYDGSKCNVDTRYDSEPYDCNSKNYFKITISDCAPLSVIDYDNFKKSLSVKLGFLLEKKPDFKLYIFDNDGRSEIKGVDMSYKSLLNGTDKYSEKVYAYETMNGDIEEIKIVCANVHEVVRTSNANSVELKGETDPYFSGVYVIAPNGVAVTIGGPDTFKILGKKAHSTKNANRIFIYVGWEIFNQMYSESSLKKYPSLKFFELKNKNNEALKVMSDDGEVTVFDIAKDLVSFVSKNSTGKTETGKSDKLDFSRVKNNCTEDEVKAFIKVGKLINGELKKKKHFQTIFNDFQKYNNNKEIEFFAACTTSVS